MGLGYLIVGCFFLLNPYFSIFDILPDFIGYACILKGLSKVSKINADFAAALRSFRTLMIVTFARMFTLPLAGGSDQTWLLLIVFCFGLGEFYLSLRAFNSMFEGFCYTAERGESSAVFEKWSEVKLITTIFVIARQALCILPELSLLSSTEYGEVTSHGINSLAQYRTVFNILGALLSLAFGIFWFVRIRSYLKGISADKDYINSIESQYRLAVGDSEKAKRYFALRFSLIMLLVAAVLSIELPFDGFNYLPHAIFAFIIALAVRRLIPYYKSEASMTFRWSLIYTITSAVVWILNFIYVRSVFGTMMDSSEEGLTLSYASVLEMSFHSDFYVQDGFIVICILTLAEAVLFAFLVHHLTKLLNAILLQYAPKREQLHQEPDDYAEWRDVIPSTKEFEPKNSFLRVTILKWSGLICAVLSPIQTALSFLLPSFWLVSFAFRLVWVVLFYLTVSKAKELVEADHMSEENPLPPHEAVR